MLDNVSFINFSCSLLFTKSLLLKFARFTGWLILFSLLLLAGYIIILFFVHKDWFAVNIVIPVIFAICSFLVGIFTWGGGYKLLFESQSTLNPESCQDRHFAARNESPSYQS
jgi:hypothetical protein